MSVTVELFCRASKRRRNISKWVKNIRRDRRRTVYTEEPGAGQRGIMPQRLK